MSIQEAKAQVLAACKKMVELGLTVGTAGNISCRADEQVFVITPTSVDYDLLGPDDLVTVTYDGKIVAGNYKPSIEVSMHRSILLARPEANAVVHTHSMFATALASCRNAAGIPPFDVETMIYLGGEISIVDFATPGSEELAALAVAGLGQKAGVLLRNHGAIGVGKTMKNAITACEIIEKSATSVFFAQLFGGMHPLPGDYVRQATAKSLLKRGICT